MEEAITQLLRYSNQRDWVEADEGAERLFHYNQLMVATWFYEARGGHHRRALRALPGMEGHQPRSAGRGCRSTWA